MPDPAEIARQGELRFTRRREMLRVDPAAETKTVCVIFFLRSPHFWTAGKHHVGHSQQFTLAPDQFRRRATEERELVHAVVNNRAFIQMASERSDSHRVVKPLDGRFEATSQWPGEQGLDKMAAL